MTVQQNVAYRGRQAGGRDPRPAGDHCARAGVPRRALRRGAPARRPGARARARPGRPPPGRADVRARHAHARGSPRRAEADARPPRPAGSPRDARLPGRGRARRSGGRARRRQAAPGREPRRADRRACRRLRGELHGRQHPRRRRAASGRRPDRGDARGRQHALLGRRGGRAGVGGGVPVGDLDRARGAGRLVAQPRPPPDHVARPDREPRPRPGRPARRRGDDGLGRAARPPRRRDRRRVLQGGRHASRRAERRTAERASARPLQLLLGALDGRTEALRASRSAASSSRLRPATSRSAAATASRASAAAPPPRAAASVSRRHAPPWPRACGRRPSPGAARRSRNRSPAPPSRAGRRARAPPTASSTAGRVERLAHAVQHRLGGRMPGPLEQRARRADQLFDRRALVVPRALERLGRPASEQLGVRLAQALPGRDQAADAHLLAAGQLVDGPGGTVGFRSFFTSSAASRFALRAQRAREPVRRQTNSPGGAAYRRSISFSAFASAMSERYSPRASSPAISPNTSVCRSTSASVVTGDISAMLWNGVRRIAAVQARRGGSAGRAGGRRRPPRRFPSPAALAGRGTRRGSRGASRATAGALASIASWTPCSNRSPSASIRSNASSVSTCSSVARTAASERTSPPGAAHAADVGVVAVDRRLDALGDLRRKPVGGRRDPLPIAFPTVSRSGASSCAGCSRPAGAERVGLVDEQQRLGLAGRGPAARCGNRPAGGRSRCSSAPARPGRRRRRRAPARARARSMSFHSTTRVVRSSGTGGPRLPSRSTTPAVARASRRTRRPVPW